MAGLFSYGLTSIEIGDVAGDGGMGTSLTALGKTLEGTCKLAMDDPSTVEFRSEESDNPELSIETMGNFTLEFTLMNPDADALVKVYGGSATGTPKVFTPPTQFAIKEQSVKITMKNGTIFKVVRAKAIGKINAELSKKNILTVDMKYIILTPTKAATAAYTFTEPA